MEEAQAPDSGLFVTHAVRRPHTDRTWQCRPNDGHGREVAVGEAQSRAEASNGRQACEDLDGSGGGIGQANGVEV